MVNTAFYRSGVKVERHSCDSFLAHFGTPWLATHKGHRGGEENPIAATRDPP